MIHDKRGRVTHVIREKDFQAFEKILTVDERATNANIF